MSSAVRVADLRVVRGDREVLRGLDFTIPFGSVTGLIGPSGSGKTTLMRTIVGVQRHVRGSTAVLGAPAGAPSLRSRLAYLTQNPSIYLDLTVTENVRYFARILRTGNDAVADALTDVQLSGHAQRVVRSLSGGEQARVALATALVGRPELLVLDEPTVGLDPVLRDSLWSTFRAYAARGATLIISSHVMDEAERCDRVLLLRDGRLLADDTPDGIRHATGANRLEDAFLTLVRNGRGES